MWNTMCGYAEGRNYLCAPQGCDGFLRSEGPLKVALLEVECPPPRTRTFPLRAQVQPDRRRSAGTPPSGTPTPRPPSASTRARRGEDAGGGPPHSWLLRRYLCGALRNLEAGALEDPHHLHLQRPLGRRRRAALARHRGARPAPSTNTACRPGNRAAPPPRPQGGGREGAGPRAGGGGPAGLPVAGEPGGRRARARGPPRPRTASGERNREPRAPRASARLAARPRPPARGPRSGTLPGFATDRLPGSEGQPAGAGSPVAPVTRASVSDREGTPGRSGGGLGAKRGFGPRPSWERGGGADHLCAPPREEAPPARSGPTAPAAEETDLSLVLSASRHEAQLLHETEGF